MAEQLAVIEAVVDRGSGEEAGVAARAMAEEGRPLVEHVAALVHEKISRKDFDKKAVLDWVDRAGKLRSALARGPGPSWKPDEPAAEVIAATGERASGVIVRVIKDGWGNDRVADLKVTVRLDNPSGTLLERSLSIPVREAPREGDRIEVAYDLADSTRFVYRADIAAPAEERVAGLSELARLYDEGLLTREEFEAEKRRLIGE